MYCIVKHCRSNWRPKSDIKFHTFPKDERRRQLWLSIVLIKGKVSERSTICSLHFKPEDYDPDRPGRLLSSASPYYMLQPCDCDDTKACTSVPSAQTMSHQGLNLHTTREMENNYGQSSKENVPADSKTSTKLVHTDIQPSPAKTDKPVEVADICTGHYSKEPVTGEDEPPAKRRCLRDFNVQVKIKSAREIELEKSKKVLHQKVTRQKRKIEYLSSVIDILRQYTSQSEIENILNGKSDHTYFSIAFHNDHSYVKEYINVPDGDTSFKKEVRQSLSLAKANNAKKSETVDATPSSKDAEDIPQTDTTTEEPAAADDDDFAPPSPVPEAEPKGAGKLFSWQNSELIPADDVEEPPSISELEDQNGVSLYCDDTPAPSVPRVPEANLKEVEYRCKDCGEIIDGFQFWCVQCFGCALCGACEARGEHKRHYVLRAPPDRPYRQTQVVLATIRHQLQNENLLTQLGTDDDGVKLEVKEEPPEEDWRIVSAAPPEDPLDAADPLRPEPAPSTTTAKVYPGQRPAKRPRLADFIERDFALRPAASARPAAPARPQPPARPSLPGRTQLPAPRGAALPVTVTSRPRPQEQILINLDDLDDQVEYVVEELETDDAVTRDDEFTEIEHLDDEDTDSGDSVSDVDCSIERLDEDDTGSIERLDEDDTASIERLDEDDAASIERLDEDVAGIMERLDDDDADCTDRIDEDNAEVTRIVNETDGVDTISEEESILSDLVAHRGVRRDETVKLTVRGPPESMIRTLSSKAVVELKPLSSLEIIKWTADTKKIRK